MWIEIKKKPGVNGNCKRLYISVNERGYPDKVQSAMPEARTVFGMSLQVTPQEYKQWDDMRKAQEGRQKP